MDDVNKIKYRGLEETDGQMILRITKKFALLFGVIFLFDSIIDLLSTLLDISGDFLHLIINFFEYSFELLIEHISNASHHESEVIIVNVALVVGFYLFYRLLRWLPKLFHGFSRRIKLMWLRRQRKRKTYWHHIPLNRKIKICCVYTVGISAILFFLTL